MGKCDLDACSLKEHIEEIKNNQVAITKAHGDMVLSQAVFVETVKGWMKSTEDAKDDNEKEHDILFAKVRLVVKWPHLATAVFVLSAIVGIVYKLASGGH